jgi:hypothetical protein
MSKNERDLGWTEQRMLAALRVAEEAIKHAPATAPLAHALHIVRDAIATATGRPA